MKIHIHFKSGYELVVSCKEFTCEKNTITGTIEQCHFSGITDNKPIDIDFNEVDCIYREVEE